MIKRTSFILMFLFSCCLVQGQKTAKSLMNDQKCSDILKEADRLFPEGHYERCINALEELLKSCDLSRSEKEHSLELLAKAYVETGDIEKAEATVNLLLVNFPHYELKEADNSEVYNRLVKKYKIHPKFSIGIRNTADWLHYTTTKVYSVLDGLDYTAPYVLKGYGFMYYGWAEFEFDKDISVNAELIWRITRYNRDIQSKVPEIGFTGFSENDSYIEIPLNLRKYYHIGQNIIPYLSAGISYLYMTKALGTASIYSTKDKILTQSDNKNILDMRNRNTFEWLAGAGIGYKLKNLRLFLDIRYYGGLNSFTNSSKRLNNHDLIDNYFYVDNSVKLNQFEIGASISYTLINSVKRVKR
jgi:opacity protein-like surface antigen